MALDSQASRDVIVIAADGALRRSLEFLLASEGLRPTSHADLSLALRAAHVRSRCVIIDDSALRSGGLDWLRLSAVGDTAILLVSRACMIPAGFAIVVEKPLIGSELIEAVRALVTVSDGSP